MADIPKPSRWHARAGAYVRLADGSIGRVMNVTPRSKAVKVRCGSKHLTCNRDDLSLVETHIAAQLLGEPWTGCCGIPASEVHPLDLLVMDPLAVTCSGMAGWPGPATPRNEQRPLSGRSGAPVASPNPCPGLAPGVS